MISLCPFTKDRCEEEACALWLKDLERCSFKEIAMQMFGLRLELNSLSASTDLIPKKLRIAKSNDLKRELERLKVDIGSIPHKIKIKT